MNKFVNSLVRILRVAFRPFFPVRVFGERNIPNKKSLLVGNHVSGWDPIIFTMWTKNVMSFVYKAEFRKIPLLRWAFDGLDCVPVRRGDIDMNATKSILHLLHNDKAVFLFPEGTRNPNVDCLHKFHTGAALFAIKTRSPIRPFYIWDKSKACRKNYMLIGEEFTLDEFYDKPITHENLEKATEAIQKRVDDLRIRLNEYLDAKGVKRRKRTRKEIEKIEAYNSKQRTLLKQLEEKQQKQDCLNDGSASGGERK
ncbi:MAG: 1-acyl-sn-glycerol-3-phosphate acyltransferase [Corallococcus sp.]|nr:1-acyl-sn-glycerol-3-phosphate acyltransferase [Bacillota bacterium]MCM1533539.1 1-acyl-sn-glycerol-3-phosphate acyltransferase [Corallococcus sp.]